MFAKGREAMRLTPAEVRLILIESLQWCANNAVYFLGLIGAATYDLAGTAFLVAAITLARNLMTSVGNMVSGSVIDRFGPRRTSFVTCVITAVLSLGVGLAPLSVPGLVFAACVLGLAGGFINTCTHAFPGYLESTTEGRTRVNGLMVFYSNIAYTAGPLLGGAIVTERIFNIPGVGSYIYTGILNRDGVAVVGAVTVLVFVYLVFNLIVDLLYGYLDPRISHD